MLLQDKSMVYDDPRDTRDETVLTESSDDELMDLQKEYELKMEALREKKRLKLQQRQRDAFHSPSPPRQKAQMDVEITRSRSPSPARNTSENIEISRLIQIEKREQVKKVQAANASGSILLSVALRAAQSVAPSSTKKNHHFATTSSTTRIQAKTAPILLQGLGSGFAAGFQTSHGQKKIDPVDREFSFKEIPKLQQNIEVDEKDSVSMVHLRKRYYTKDQLLKMVEKFKILSIDKFFAKVYPPLFTEPQYPNWVLVGIVLHKSETKFTNDKKKSRYLKLSVGDLDNISVDILLFGDAYTKYWKLRVGDVVAVLNPTIKPYRMSLTTNSMAEKAQNQSPRGFNLVLDDSAECLVEIGTAKYFGFCKSIKKDGHRCSTPVNTKKSDYCNFHQEMQVRKTGGKRMELNGGVSMKSPTRLDGTKKAMYMNTQTGGAIMTDYSQYKQPTHDLYYSGHSFFRDEYSDPKMLENLTEKRRKLKDKHEDTRLQARLNKLNSQAKLRSLGLASSHSSSSFKDINDGSKPIEKIAFNQSIVKQIGFNPTTSTSLRSQDAIYKSPTRKRREMDENIQDLYKLSSLSVSKKLTESLQDKQDKKKKWQANISNMQLYKKQTTHGLQASPFIDKFGPSSTAGGEDMFSSDSDIEIEFNNDKEKNNYSKLVNYKQT